MIHAEMLIEPVERRGRHDTITHRALVRILLDRRCHRGGRISTAKMRRELLLLLLLLSVALEHLHPSIHAGFAQS